MKKAMIAALTGIGIGIVLVAIGLSMGAKTWIYADLEGIHVEDSNKTMEENRVANLDIEAFKNIEINGEYEDIEFIQSDKFGIDIVYTEYNYYDVEWSVENEKLKININSESKMRFFNMDFNFFSLINYKNNNYIKIYIPQNVELDNITINSQGDMDLAQINNLKVTNLVIDNLYGNLKAKNIESDSIKITMGSGNTNINSVNTKEFIYKNSYGNADFESITSEKLDIHMSSGNLKIDRGNVKTINTESNYGKIEMSDNLAENMKIIAKSGNVNLDNNTFENLVIKSDYGNVKVINSKYGNVEINAKSGDINFSNNVLEGTKIESDYGKVKIENSQIKNVDIDAHSGNVSLQGDFTGNIKIKSDYGKVSIDTNQDKKYYNIKALTRYGKININDEKIGDNYTGDNNSEYMIEVEASSGDIIFNFNK